MPVCKIVLIPDIGVVSNVATPVDRTMESGTPRRVTPLSA
jgi:hypothetical protein